MRTRDKRLSDYGVWEEDEKKLIAFCRTLDQKGRLSLFQCAVSAAPGLELAIYESLIAGEGFRSLQRKGRDVPAKEDDFYAYRRKTLATFYNWLRLTGEWENVGRGRK